MALYHLFLLALIQGITEFLPISSSGHLILLPVVTGLPDQGHLMDVAVHVGTLVAVMLYFWRDTRGLAVAGVAMLGVSKAQNFIESERSKAGTDYRKLLWALIIATLPIVIFGTLVVKSGAIDLIRSAEVIATTSIVFGILLYMGDQKKADKEEGKLGIKAALIVGFSQVIALIPGSSRSGITMTAARYLGFDRRFAARFSMLLSIPTILGAGVMGLSEVLYSGDVLLLREAMIAAVLSFIFAILGIHFLMRWLANRSMTVFVLYRLVLGAGLFALIGFGYI